jgi:hypothetical protein
VDEKGVLGRGEETVMGDDEGEADQFENANWGEGGPSDADRDFLRYLRGRTKVIVVE